MLSVNQLRKRCLLLGTIVALVCGSAAVTPPTALAYNGEFCYHVYLSVHHRCLSNYVYNIRRAVAHGADWTYVEMDSTVADIYASCGSDGCTADTGYGAATEMAMASCTTTGTRATAVAAITGAGLYP